MELKSQRFKAYSGLGRNVILLLGKSFFNVNGIQPNLSRTRFYIIVLSGLDFEFSPFYSSLWSIRAVMTTPNLTMVTSKYLPAKVKAPHPVIGLVMQEINYTRTVFKSFMDPSEENLNHEFSCSSYVKYLEQAGGRVVPIFTHRKPEYYERMFNLTNGLLIPGGAAGLVSSGVV